MQSPGVEFRGPSVVRVGRRARGIRVARCSEHGECGMTGDNRESKGRGRPKSMERSKVLQGATELYWREGVQTLSLNEVCRQVSVSKPSIYREFGGEDGLVDAVLGHYRDAVIAPILAFLEQDLPFAELLEGAIQGMTAPREHPPGCLFTEMRMIRQHLGPQSRAHLETMETEWVAAFASWYARALEKGEANATLSPDQAATFIDSQFSLVLLQMGMERSAEDVQAGARLALQVLTQSG